MNRPAISLILQKSSKSRGEIYPIFDRESQQKAFEGKRKKIQSVVKKIEKVLNTHKAEPWGN